MHLSFLLNLLNAGDGKSIFLQLKWADVKFCQFGGHFEFQSFKRIKSFKNFALNDTLALSATYN